VSETMAKAKAKIAAVAIMARMSGLKLGIDISSPVFVSRRNEQGIKLGWV